MDALRLIKSTRHGLSEARSVPQVLAEAWQACALIEAVALVLALELTETTVLDGGGCGATEIARAVAEAAGHGAACVGRPPDDGAGPSRAERLSVLADLSATVRELRILIQETAEALIVVACGAAEQELYWRCIDSVDASTDAQSTSEDDLRRTRLRVDDLARLALLVIVWTRNRSPRADQPPRAPNHGAPLYYF